MNSFNPSDPFGVGPALGVNVPNPLAAPAPGTFMDTMTKTGAVLAGVAVAAAAIYLWRVATQPDPTDTLLRHAARLGIAL